MKKKALITGGAGFIGSHAVDEFLENGYEVTVLDALRTGDVSNIRHVMDRIRFVEGDICDSALVESLVDSDTVVVNLAAQISVPESIEDPETAHRINVDGTHALLVASKAKGAKKFVSASSAAVYGSHAPVPTPESFPHECLSPYGLHKSINEQYGKLYSDLYGLKTVFLRFFNVYGPRQKAEGGYASVIPVFIKKALAGVAPSINGSGSISRDFVYVKDVARAIRLAAEADAGTENAGSFQVFNIATGKPTTLDELWNVLCEIKQIDMKPAYAEKRPGDIEASLADVSKATEMLGFEAKASLKDGLETTLNMLESISPWNQK